MKEVKIKRFFRVTKKELRLYSSLYSTNLIYDKPVESILFKSVRFIKFESFLDGDLRKNLKLFWYLNTNEDDEGEALIRFGSGSKVKLVTLNFYEVEKAKEFLSLYFISLK